ncbi:unnamed protein product [Arctia plantaginis]|uniref:Uncharacterized protein n=1 Tax=Arctia plantaginis TaxID=874455 RepID=A0A8S1B211_ARCPL|nr:unnamed protein product [Arctia plantaginis]
MDFHTLQGSAIKLEGQKIWRVWRFQMSVTLRGADLFSIVTGLEKESDNFAARDAKAQPIMVSRLTEAVMVHVLTCMSSEDMWKTLHSVFEAKSATRHLKYECPKRNIVYDKSSGCHAFISHILSSSSNMDISNDDKWLVDSGAGKIQNTIKEIPEMTLREEESILSENQETEEEYFEPEPVSSPTLLEREDSENEEEEAVTRRGRKVIRSAWQKDYDLGFTIWGEYKEWKK